MAASSVSTVKAIRDPKKCFPNLASFQQVDAESEIAFSKKDETFQESQGILSPLRLPVPPRPLIAQEIRYLARLSAGWKWDNPHPNPRPSFKGMRGSRKSLNADIWSCFRQSQRCPLNEGQMFSFSSYRRPFSRSLAVPALLALAGGLSGCAEMGDNMISAFADPAKYDLYECKQLEPERLRLATRAAELQGLMAKAETGVAGPVVAELAYRNDYISTRGQARLADEAWRRNKCHETPAATPAPAAPTPPPAPAKGKRPH